MIYPLEIALRRLQRRFSRNEWALRRLRLTTSEGTSEEPGLLLIQIDGFSRAQLEKALAKGTMPFLRSLINRQHYEPATFYSGLPSTTPAVQAELFYGVCCAVPAFSFLDRPTKRIATMFKPDWVKRIESELAKHDEGLLTGGSSWSNIYAGGARPEETHFCAAGLGAGDFFKSGSLWGLLSIALLQFPAILRLVGLLVVELILGLWDVVRGVSQGESLKEELKFIVSRVFVSIGLREVITVGAGVDLARGLPVVHVNFLGYDEQSHRRGPGSAFAHWSLRGIDSAVRKLYRAAQSSSRRDYQVWIFSDHGQETVRSYYEEFPPGIEKYVADALEHMKRWAKRTSHRLEVRPSRVYWAGGRRALAAFEEQSRRELLTTEEEQTFSVTALGPVGHLYLGLPMSMEEKLELANWLTTRGHVPGVLLPSGEDKVLWVHSRGLVNLPEEAPRFLPHPGRLKEQIAFDLVRLCRQEYSGDLVLLGWTPDEMPWTFALERGAHGGPGMEETCGFVLLPANTRLPETAQEFIRPLDLRAAALHHLGRRRLPARRRVSELVPGRRLRLMTYNVHSCIGMDGRVSPERIARIATIYRPDILALQELDLGRARSRSRDQAKFIADELEMHVSFCPTVLCDEEYYGHALLTRVPHEVVRSGFLARDKTPPRTEPRGALLARLELLGRKVYVLNTHFGLSRFERRVQVADLLGDNWLGSLPKDAPLIVCGDFNMTPGSFAYRALASRLHDAQLAAQSPTFRPLKTFAALYPFSRIDHIFVSHHFIVENVQVPQTDLTRVASDHLPVIADVALQEAA